MPNYLGLFKNSDSLPDSNIKYTPLVTEIAADQFMENIRFSDTGTSTKCCYEPSLE